MTAELRQRRRLRFFAGGLLALSLGLARPAHALVWPDVPERVERDLASDDVATRRTAAQQLESLGHARGTPLVLRALGDSDTDVRLAAARAAATLHVDAGLDVVLPWLLERDARLRVAACDVAKALPSPRSVPVLARALSDADPAVRAACADALGAQGSTDATEPLAGKLDDAAPAVRVRVVDALARIEDPRAVVPLVGKVQDSAPEVRQAVVRALGALGDPRAVQALLLSLRDNATEVKIEALGALGRMRVPEAVPSIAPLATDRERPLQQAALAALGRIGSPEARRALVKWLGTGDDAAAGFSRNALRDALLAIGPAVVPDLEAVLERPASKAAADSAAWLLGGLRAKASAGALVAALRRGAVDPAFALYALVGAGTSAEVPVALEFLTDPDAAVRAQALAASAELLDPSHPDGRAVEPLVAALRAPHATLDERISVAKLLGRTGSKRAGLELAKLVTAKDDALRLAAVDALAMLGDTDRASASGVADDALVGLLRDPDPAVVMHAAIALGESGGARAQKALLDALDGDGEVDRYALARALGGIVERRPSDAAVDRLVRELDVAAGPERDAWIEALGRAPTPNAVRALERIARARPDDRRTAVAALGAHRGDALAFALAKEALADPDPAVRAEAAFVLGSIGRSEALPILAPRVGSTDAMLATNAVAAIATLARDVPATARDASTLACAALGDRRDAVRVNALVALANARARCGDGRAISKLATDDPSALVRTAAERALAIAADQLPNAQAATPSAPSSLPASPPRRAVTVFVAAERDAAPKPGAPYTLEYDGGLLRAGLTDRRGAIFDPSAPKGGVLSLRRTSVR